MKCIPFSGSYLTPTQLKVQIRADGSYSFLILDPRSSDPCIVEKLGWFLLYHRSHLSIGMVKHVRVVSIKTQGIGMVKMIA